MRRYWDEIDYEQFTGYTRDVPPIDPNCDDCGGRGVVDRGYATSRCNCVDNFNQPQEDEMDFDQRLIDTCVAIAASIKELADGMASNQVNDENLRAAATTCFTVVEVMHRLGTDFADAMTTSFDVEEVSE